MRAFNVSVVLAGISALVIPTAADAQVRTQANRANPDISINLLTLGRMGTGAEVPGFDATNGFSLQEAELRITSNIDTYFRGDVVFAFHPPHSDDHDHDEGGGEAHGGMNFGIEEAFVETLSLPSLTVRAGKFLAAFSRHNLLHTHLFPFVDRPLVHQAVLGEDGLNEIGLSAAWLAPAPWYLEVIAQGLSAQNESIFNSATRDDLAGVLTVRNLWDLSDNDTLSFDMSGAAGANSAGGNTSMFAFTAGYKWRPMNKTVYNSFSLMGEYLYANRALMADPRVGGLATWAQYQFNRVWWVQGRYEKLGFGVPDSDLDTTRVSALVGYVPTEYSALRLQYDVASVGGHSHAASTHDHGNTEHRLTLQLNVSIGAHPAHLY